MLYISLTAEEIENAASVIPRSMLVTVALNGGLGFAMLIATLYCLGDLNAALNTPTGYPFIEIFYSATQSTGGATALVRAGIFCTLSIQLLTSVACEGIPRACNSHLSNRRCLGHLLAYDVGVRSRKGSSRLPLYLPGNSSLPLFSFTTHPYVG
jgi:amino acid transporter